VQPRSRIAQGERGGVAYAAQAAQRLEQRQVAPADARAHGHRVELGQQHLDPGARLRRRAEGKPGERRVQAPAPVAGVGAGEPEVLRDADVDLDEDHLPGPGMPLGLHARDALEAGVLEQAPREGDRLGHRVADHERAHAVVRRVLAQLAPPVLQRVAAVGAADDDRALEGRLGTRDVLRGQHAVPVVQGTGDGDA